MKRLYQLIIVSNTCIWGIASYAMLTPELPEPPREDFKVKIKKLCKMICHCCTKCDDNNESHSDSDLDDYYTSSVTSDTYLLPKRPKRCCCF